LHYNSDKKIKESEDTMKTTSTPLINTAEHYHRNGHPVPTDVLARLLEVGVDISKYS